MHGKQVDHWRQATAISTERDTRSNVGTSQQGKGHISCRRAVGWRPDMRGGVSPKRGDGPKIHIQMGPSFEVARASE